MMLFCFWAQYLYCTHIGKAAPSKVDLMDTYFSVPTTLIVTEKSFFCPMANQRKNRRKLKHAEEYHEKFSQT